MEILKNYLKLRCRDSASLEQKLKKFTADGPEHLLVIADFDYTLSRSKTQNGEYCAISYGVFEEEAKRTSEEQKRMFTELNKKYHPIELDPKLPISEKLPHMVVWWEKSNKLILKANYTKNYIKELVAKTNICLRCGVSSMLDDLNRYDIPLVIFSAGIGDVIKICLERETGRVFPNIHIISNMFIYDEAGVASGFSSPLIHTFCKEGSMIEKCPSLKQKLDGRYNVILLGDSLGDVTMADGYFTNGGNVTTLKIGFLNRYFDEHFEDYCDSFDAVLVDDQTVDFPTKIINGICAGNLNVKNLKN